jgi:hypothetical protein
VNGGRVLHALAGQRRHEHVVSPLDAVEGRPPQLRVTPADDAPPPRSLNDGIGGLSAEQAIRLAQLSAPAVPEDGPRAPLVPLSVRPVGVSRRAAVEMLLNAVAGLQLERADRSLLVRAEAAWDTPDVVILASLLARARHLGQAGHDGAGVRT